MDGGDGHGGAVHPPLNGVRSEYWFVLRFFSH